jgi:outer membrane protein assembly factor BamB
MKNKLFLLSIIISMFFSCNRFDLLKPIEDSNKSPKNIVWKYKCNGSINLSPAIGSDGTIFIGDTTGYLYAINPDGSLKWSYKLGDCINSSPTIARDGTIYICSNYYLYARNYDGSPKWFYATTLSIFCSSPTILNNCLYIVAGSGFLYALNTTNGKEIWTNPFIMEGGITSSPAIGNDGTIYIGCLDGKLYAINPNRSLKWRFSTGDSIGSSPIIGNDGVICFGSFDKSFYVLNPINGEPVFPMRPTNSRISSPVIGSDGSIYFANTDGHFFRLSTNGDLKWEIILDSPIESSPAIGNDGTIYVTCTNGKVYEVYKDGTSKLLFQADGEIISSPAIGNDGTIYFGSINKNLYAIKTNCGGLADTLWPKFLRNNKNTSSY